MGNRLVSGGLLIDSSNNMMVRGVLSSVDSKYYGSGAFCLFPRAFVVRIVTPCVIGIDEIWRPNEWLRCAAGQTKPSIAENACFDCPPGTWNVQKLFIIDVPIN
jgi:hypothetical protein